MSALWAALAFLVGTLAASGCGLYGATPELDDPSGPGTRPPSGPGDVEQVQLHIAEVPADVACVKITAVGAGRTVEREIAATGGASLTENLSGLPVGTVVFTGDAYTQACTSVSKSTVSAWASAPVEASVVLGRLATVELVMVRNGRAKVDVTFTDEAACTATGAACRINSECCSKRCSAGACLAADAGLP